VFVEIKTKTNVTEQSEEKLDVTVLRPQRVIDRLFTYSVIILVSILYVNFGAAMSLSAIKDILRRPVGPAICFVCQFLFMPLAAYGLGFGLFPKAHEMALGLFFTGISPGGGASNMWTLLLGGNINLSIAMTTISTLAAFFMMPLWIFTLGKTIFDRANLGVPYARISSMAVGLLIPLAIGLLIQRFMPRTTKVLVRILKPLSLILILFIVIFAIITNLYIFQLFTWQVNSTISSLRSSMQ
jgi:solute carrier family 10 (sodium/bile acid cotransporter), member 3/5